MRFLTEVSRGARALLRQPLWASSVVVLLTLGIGANMAIFTVLRGVVLQPPPFPAAERLVMVWETMGDDSRRLAAPANFLDWRRQARSFDGLAAFRFGRLSWTASGPPQVLAAQFVSGDLFRLLGARPAAGRLLDRADETGDSRLVVIGEALWRQRFAGRADAIGKTMMLDEEPYRIVGVLPAGFKFLRRSEVWTVGRRGIPGGSSIEGDATTVRDSHFLRVLGRLRPGVSIESARSEMAAIARALAAAYPDTNHLLGANVTTLQAVMAGDTRPTLLAVQAGAALLLLVAGANVAALLLGRAVQRAREVAIRQALGAGRAAALREAFAEGAVLSLAAAAAALAMAWLGTRWLVRAAPEGLPRLEEIHLSAASLALGAALAALAAVVLAIVPLLQRRAVSPAVVLRAAGSGGGGSRGAARLGAGLTIFQLALAQALVVGAVLLSTSFARLRAVDPGVRSAGVLVVDLNLADSKKADPQRKNRFYDAVLARLRTVPGVGAAELTLTPPLDGPVSRGFWIEGRPHGGPNQVDIVAFQEVSAGYFQALGVPLLRGRAFLALDTGGPGAAIVNQALARRYFPGEEALGKRIGFGREGDPAQLRTIVGVCGDVRENGLAEPVPPVMYVPYQQDFEPWNLASLIVRGKAPGGDPALLAEPVRRAILEVDPAQPVTRARTLAAALSEELAPRRFSLLLAALFAGLALLIAAVGTYGVVAFDAARRRREFGIRLALGAQVRQVVAGVLGGGARLGALGVAGGVLAAWALARVLRGLLYGTELTDPATLSLAALLVLAFAAAASLVPALRAGATPPAVVLRDE
ncbi:MAG TPA: ADOP family duplicated permease [Thermoanaerobaculia bacterium]|nr:ADOP family duplicated permease [Thermoanaerobaculia bacterium]